MITPSVLAVLAIPAKFQDLITFAFYAVLAILFLVAVVFAAWGGMSLERREEAFLKVKGTIMAFAVIALIGAIFDYFGWSAAIGISFYNL